MDRIRHLVRSTVLVILIYGLNKITGLGKLFFMTAIFGTGVEADAFAAANQLPELFYAMLAGGAVAAALIPVYTNYLTKREHEASRSLAHTVFTLTLIVVGGLCAVTALAAPWLVRVFLVPDFPPAQQALTADLMRVILLSSVVISVGAIITTLLHAHQHFIAPAWGTVVIDLGQIFGLAVLTPVWGIYGAAWGSVIGALLLVAVQIPTFLRRGIGYRPRLDLHMAGVHELVRLMGPRIITLGAYQAVDLIVIRLASQLPTGSISAYFYAMLAMVAMPRSLFGYAISNVIFPSMAEQYNEGDETDLRQTVVQGLRAVWALTIPSAIGLLALGPPAVAFLFERGAFGAESTTLVYTLMAILSVRLISDASQDVLTLIFFARHDTSTPMWAHLGWMALNLGLSLFLVRSLGVIGLAWAASLSSLALTLALYVLGRWQLEGLKERRLTGTLGHLLLASAGMAGAILLLRQQDLDTLLFLPAAIVSGGLTFLLIYGTLGGRELFAIWHSLRNKAVQPTEAAR